MEKIGIFIAVIVIEFTAIKILGKLDDILFELKHRK